LQFQADILNATVVRPEITEITAIGAAYLAGLAVGFWNDIAEIQQQWKIDKSFQPDGTSKEDLIKGWYRAIKAANSWTESENSTN
jgi:glycerol kinase